jgi:hypothetical protein
MAGYSGTPLAKKLGIKEKHRLALIKAPDGFEVELDPMPEDVEVSRRAAKALDIIVVFVKSAAELTEGFARLASRIVPNGMIWVAWPKKASGLQTDLSENLVREIGLEAGLVDTKVCAVNEVWSGLKFVYRLKDRPGLVRS